MKNKLKTIGGAILVLSLCSTAFATKYTSPYLGDNWKVKKPVKKLIEFAKTNRLQYHWERELFPEDTTSHLGAKVGNNINYLRLVQMYRGNIKKVPCTRKVLMKAGTLIARKGSTKFDVTEKGNKHGVMIYNPILGSGSRINYAVSSNYVCAIINY